MIDRQIFDAGIFADLPPKTSTPPRAPVTAAWLAEQNRKQASYTAKRSAWQIMLERRAGGADAPEIIVCRCGKCGRRLRGGAQLRLSV